jgi:macrolide transport system ATP-binding/permease protein
MTTLAKLRSWLRSLFHRSQLEAEMQSEMSFHVAARAEELERSGLAPQLALRQARVEFGSLDSQKEECRQALGLRLWDELRADLRYALRLLWKRPGFSLLAILCLTLGIGSTAAVFSWIEGTLLRPYPAVAHQERLVVLAGTNRGVSGYEPLSLPDFRDYERGCNLFDAFIAEKIAGANLSVGERSERVTGSLVSANYFAALGLRPILGRGFQPGEDTGRNAHPVIVISYQFWKERIHSDPNIIGKTQMLNNERYTVVGVAPQGFYGTFVGYSWGFWVPLSMQEKFDPPNYKLEDRGEPFIEGFARLKPGVTIAQAQQQISVVARELEASYPQTDRGHGVQLLTLAESPFNGSVRLRPVLAISLAVAFFVLLIACANVSNLLLVRAFARRHEISVRLAVGARRLRLFRQLFTEGLLLSSIGTALGLLLAYWGRHLIVLVWPVSSSTIYLSGQLDWRVIVLSAAVCLFATLIFGVAPALRAGRLDLAGALNAEAGGVVFGSGRSRLRSALVLVEVALSFLLLVGATLMMQSVRAIRNASPGFSIDVQRTAINLLSAGYEERRARDFEQQLLGRVQNLPGIQAAALARVSPFAYRAFSYSPIVIDDYQPAPGEQPSIAYDEITPGFFATLGIPLLSGRDFTSADDETGASVAIVNDTMVNKYWRGADPVGKRLQVKGRALRVVGVVRTAKYRTLTEAPEAFFYVPLRQNPAKEVVLFLRSSQSPGTNSRMLAHEVHEHDPNLPVYDLLTMRDAIQMMSASQNAAVVLLATFGGLALLLAAIGLYGVMSYAVSQSTRELGLRMALGANATKVLGLIFRQGLTVTAAGISAGCAAALLLTRLLGYLLYNTSPRDPLAFGSAFAVMFIAAVAACFVPAWRASRVDPLRALRN